MILGCAAKCDVASGIYDINALLDIVARSQTVHAKVIRFECSNHLVVRLILEFLA